MIVFASRGLGARAVYWSATRGEGGANASGPERAEALGVVRTWESLAARRLDGGEVVYGPFYDFGFCKRADAAMDRWGRDALVEQIVGVIRRVRPQVVVSRWSGTAEDGHGQHQAVGLAAIDAFALAADPSFCPAMPAWAPDRLYRSTGGDWQAGEEQIRPEPAEEPGDVWIDAGAVDPVSGRSFEEIAREGTMFHRSQGLALLPQPGRVRYCYRLLSSRAGQGAGFFDGLDVGLASLAGDSADPFVRDALVRAQKCAEQAFEMFHPHRPRDVLSLLGEAIVALGEAAARVPAGMPATTAIEERRRAFERIAARCAGMRVEALASTRRPTPGSEIDVAVRVHGVPHASIVLQAPAGWDVVERPDASPGSETELVESGFVVRVPPDAPFTVPNWLAIPRTGDRYVIDHEPGRGTPLDPPLLIAEVRATVDGAGVAVDEPVVVAEAFPGGFRRLAPAVVPPIGLRPASLRRIVAASDRPRRIEMVIESEGFSAGHDRAALRCDVPAGWSVHPSGVSASCEAGRTEAHRFEIVVPSEARGGTHAVRFRAEVGGRTYDAVLDPVRRSSAGLPADPGSAVLETFVPARADVEILVSDARFASSLRYGYVRGDEASLTALLSDFGLDVHDLSDDDIAFGDLERFDAVLIGSRAYATRASLGRNATRLSAYADAGGTLIVLAQGYGYDTAGAAPLPIAYAHPHDRVTMPDAPVTILQPQHPAVRLPNRIEPSDFDGWVRERGRYFAATWDPRLTPVLASADPGESSVRGGLLVGAFGRGSFAYCGYSLATQIEAGVAGAVRLLANLFALPESRIAEKMSYLRAVPLFDGATEDELHRVARMASQRHFAAGETLCRQGDRSEEMYVVVDGEVEIVKGAGAAVATARAGAVIGELAVLSEAPRSATMIARGDVETLVLRGAHLRALLRNQPEMSERMMALLAAKLAADGRDG